jgi:hypothetical protein
MEKAMAFVVKTEVTDLAAVELVLRRQKTMYGGNMIATGDVIFVFASETEGGKGLVARGIVTHAQAVAKQGDTARQTPRVDVTIHCTACTVRALGRVELRGFRDWTDGRAETELNFKLYRQATNKIIGISDATAAFLAGCF